MFPRETEIRRDEHDRLRFLIERMQSEGAPEQEIVSAVKRATGEQRRRQRRPPRDAGRLSSLARKLVRR